jgi:hypothetical protein
MFYSFFIPFSVFQKSILERKAPFHQSTLTFTLHTKKALAIPASYSTSLFVSLLVMAEPNRAAIEV